MQLVLNGILFCFILLLCSICYGVGFYLGFKKKIKPEPKPLTKEQQRQAERYKRQEENFWNYNGTNQDELI